MYGINVFLAGSTKENAQRNRNNIRILLSRLQNRLRGAREERIALYVHDYKDFESKQTKYNEFIQSDTDIFIALVDAKYDTKELVEKEEGKGTYAEFLLACRSFIEQGKPEVILLYKTDKEHRKPSKRWIVELEKIGKYAIHDTKYHLLNSRLENELTKTICKFLPNTPKATPPKYKIGDVYEKGGVKGIIFSINDSGKSGKIISIKPSTICSWNDFQKKKTPFAKPWRVPELQELEEILINRENYQIISKALKNLKDGAYLEHDKWRDSFLSCTPYKAFRQKSVRWSHTKQCFSTGDCETSYVGIIRPVAEIDL